MDQDIQFPRKSFYSQEDNTLHCGYNSGFFSNCSITLWYLIDLCRQGIHPERVDFSNSFRGFKTRAQEESHCDVYHDYFHFDTAARITIPPRDCVRQETQGAYLDYSYETYTPFIEKFFAPSAEVVVIQNTLTTKYGIEPDRTIVVCYRGTDKGDDLKLADPKHYLDQAEKLLRRHPGFRILIQTDQKQVRDLFVNHFGADCVFFSEMPVTKEQTVMHHLDDQALGVDRLEFARTLLAVTLLISKCALIVNHTGNVASWICLYRGNATNVLQFSRGGHLLTERSKSFWMLVEKLSRNIGRVTSSLPYLR